MHQQTRTLRQQIDEYERQILADTLKAFDTRTEQAARLGISNCTLQRKLSRHGLIGLPG